MTSRYDIECIMIDIKICGLKTAETLDAALEGGARYVGFVFFPASPRNIDLKTARTLADRARGKRASWRCSSILAMKW